MNNSALPPHINVNDLGNDDLGTYSLTQIKKARRTLMATVHGDLMLWQNFCHKLGIRADSTTINQLRSNEEPLWIPEILPRYWSAPVVLQNSVNDVTPSTSCSQTPSPAGSYQDQDANVNELHATFGKGTSSQSLFRLDNRRTHSDHDLPESRRSREHLSPAQVSRFVDNRKGHVDHDLPKSRQSREHLSPPRDRWSVDNSKTSSHSRKRSPYGREESEGSAAKRFRPEGSNRQAWEPGVYEMMYKCDICGYTNFFKNATIRHLWQKEHYSASHCLGFLNKNTGALEPKYTRQPSVLRREDQQWKGLVPACPQCHKVFQSAGDCVQHAFSEHGISDTYVLRKELRPLSLFRCTSNSDYCLECRKEMSQLEMFRHIKETIHMTSALRGRNSLDMTIFLCQFCDKIVDNYYLFRAHFLDSHPDRLGRQMLLGGASLQLGGNAATLKLLPPDPGVPLKCINFNFSSQAERDKSLEKAVQEEKLCLKHGPAAYTRIAKSLEEFLSCRGRAITLKRASSPVKSELALLWQQQEKKRVEEQQKHEEATKGTEMPRVKKNRHWHTEKPPTYARTSQILTVPTAQQLGNLPHFLSEMHNKVKEKEKKKSKKEKKKRRKKQIIKQKLLEAKFGC